MNTKDLDMTTEEQLADCTIALRNALRMVTKLELERDADRAELADCKKKRNELAEVVVKIALLDPKPSIWRPMSEYTEILSDRNPNSIIVCNTLGFLVPTSSRMMSADDRFWTRTADLLALAPLPNYRTQEELDAEWITRTLSLKDPCTRREFAEAIAYGRSTPKP